MFKIKAVGDMVLDVLAIPFGSPSDKDLDGDYFSKDTDLHLDKFTDPLILYWHGRDVGGNEQQKAEVIGQSLGHTIKPDGVWLRVRLDQANRYAQRVWEAAKQGIAAASSGSVAHLVRRAKDGFIRSWPLIELSLFDIDKAARRMPSNKNALALPAAKALYTQAGRSFPETDGEYISEAEGKALQKKARDMLVADAVEDFFWNTPFDRKPSDEEKLYSEAAKAMVWLYANTRIKSLPVRVTDYMPDGRYDGVKLAGHFSGNVQGEPRILLSSHYSKSIEFDLFCHEVGHAIDYFNSDTSFKSAPTEVWENRAEEWVRLLKSTAFELARRQFYGGKLSVKTIPINKLLEALA